MEYPGADCQRDWYWTSQGLGVPMCTTTHRQSQEGAQCVSMGPDRFRLGQSYRAGPSILCPVQAHGGYLGPTHRREMLLATCHISCWVYWVW